MGFSLLTIIGRTKDFKSDTNVIYAQVRVAEYLKLVGEFETFTIQRRRESHKAYGRLRDDIRMGASLPSITLSLKPEYVNEAVKLLGDEKKLTDYLSQPGRCDILDGLQRTYIIRDIESSGFKFHEDQRLLLEIWLETDLQKLIYRIIVLNAGQKPMSVRHQLELLFTSLKKSIEEAVGGIELVTEKDQRRRRRPGIFPHQIIVSGYQAFISGSTELNKDNLISQQLQVDSALDSEEDDIQGQFTSFVEYLGIYRRLDEQVFRLYASPTDDREEVAENELASRHWLTNENTCIAFFASISQFIPREESSASTIKRQRVSEALDRMLELLTKSEPGSDPLKLAAFEAIRAGKSARKINVGSYTRRTLSNGFKEYFRAEGEIDLAEAWNLAVD